MTRISVDGLSTITCATLAPNGHIAAVGDVVGHIGIVDLRDKQTLALIDGHRVEVRAVEFSKVDKLTLISGGEDGAVHLWNVQSGERVRTLRASGSPVRALAVAGDWLAIAAEQPNIELLDLSGKLATKRLVGHKGWVRTVAFSHNGTILATGGHDGSIRLWSVPKGTLLKTLDGHPQWVNALAFAPDNHLLATAGFEKRIALWNIETGERIAELSGHVRRVANLAFDDNGALLAAASLDRTVTLWNVADHMLMARLNGHRYQVVAAAFSPTSATLHPFLLTASSDGYLRLWSLPIRIASPLQPLPPPGAGEITLRNFTTGERLRVRVVDENGVIMPDALVQLARFMRSMPDGAAAPPQAALVKLLFQIADHFGRQREIIMISGYRSEAYNALRTRQSKEVAKKSKHMLGQAMDMRVDGIPAADLAAYVRSLKAGGVGLYTDSQFVHVDVGPVRSWGGR